MGTHPIFESDFDCLTEMGDIPDPGAMPPVEDPTPVQENPTPVDPVFTAHMTISNFFANYGWYLLFGFVVFSIVWKNLEKKLEQLRRAWEDAKIKKDPDSYHAQEEDRMSRLERLQAQYDKQAIIRKEREEEIAAARRERDEAKEQCKGKESMKRWEEGQIKLTNKTGNTTGSDEQPKKPTTTQRKKPSTFKRAEYNPLMGAGGGGGFKSNRPKPRGGG